MNKLLSISLEPASIEEMTNYIDELTFAKADYLHVDVMDGIFVRKKTFDSEGVDIIKEYSTIPLDVHLMIFNPSEEVKKYVKIKPEFLTVQYESFYSEETLTKTLKKIKRHKIKSGLSIAFNTPIYSLTPFLPYVDMILVMGVECGASGQVIDKHTFQRVTQIKNLINSFRRDILIEVDGGINENNSQKLFDAGADILVSGSSVYTAKSKMYAIRKLKGEVDY